MSAFTRLLRDNANYRYNSFADTGSPVLLAPVTLWLAAGAGADFSRVRWTGWLSVAYMAIFPSVIAYLIFYYALRYMPSSLVAGGALVLAGVFWTERT